MCSAPRLMALKPIGFAARVNPPNLESFSRKPYESSRRTGGTKMRRVIGIAIATAIAGSAMAADLPVTPPAPVLTYNWTGIYGGVNGGWGFGQQDPFNTISG
jgi:hypothetical protein